MSVLSECPTCHRKQSAKNKLCKCGEDLDKAKRSKKVEFWIDYRVPGEGKQIRMHVGQSIEEARDADGKRRTQKRENRIFDMLPESTMTFKELTDWYLSLEKVKAIKSLYTKKIFLNKFNREFGTWIVNTIKPTDLENHQVKREKEGNKPKTVDEEINQIKAMVNKAFNDNMVGGDVMKVFKNIKRTLKPNSNRRNRVLTVQEYGSLYENAPLHLQGIISMGYWTGMRKGEIIHLTWDKVDISHRVIRLEATDTKEEAAKTIPIGEELLKVLKTLPRGIHGKTVFLYAGRALRNRFDAAMITTCERAGIMWGKYEKDGFIFHDLRHTFVTDMRRAGVDRTVTMAITGHAIEDMNQRYDTIEEWEKLEAIAKLEAYRRKAVATVDQNVDQAASAGNKTLILFEPKIIAGSGS